MENRMENNKYYKKAGIVDMFTVIQFNWFWGLMRVLFSFINCFKTLFTQLKLYLLGAKWTFLFNHKSKTGIWILI